VKRGLEDCEPPPNVVLLGREMTYNVALPREEAQEGGRRRHLSGCFRTPELPSHRLRLGWGHL
jgi:hypothetical protein